MNNGGSGCGLMIVLTVVVWVLCLEVLSLGVVPTIGITGLAMAIMVFLN